MFLWLFVALRVVANPLANLFQKRLALGSAHPIFVIAVTHAALSLACLPWLLSATSVALPWPFWRDIGLAASLAVAGNAVLVAALARSDLSVLGPINAYKAVISLALAAIVLNEIPTLAGMAGVLLIVAGSYFVIDRPAGLRRSSALRGFFADRGIQLRFLALALTATEAVFLKSAIGQSSPMTTFVWWSVIGVGVAGVASALFIPGRIAAQCGILLAEWRNYLALAFAAGLMQLATLLSFEGLQVGYALALFQLSTLVSVFLGYRYFQEQNIRRRLLGSLIMIVGAVLIVLLGRSAD